MVRATHLLSRNQPHGLAKGTHELTIGRKTIILPKEQELEVVPKPGVSRDYSILASGIEINPKGLAGLYRTDEKRGLVAVRRIELYFGAPAYQDLSRTERMIDALMQSVRKDRVSQRIE